MPRKVTAWACSFGCGRKVQTVRKRMENHEKRCTNNPATRACPTCEHNYREWDSSAYLADGEVIETEYWFWDCAIEKLPEKDKNGYPRLVFDCEDWEPQEEQQCNEPK